MKKKMDEFDESLIKQLKDPAFASAYLNEHLSYHGPKRVELILEAMHKIVEAKGISVTAKKAKISRRTFFHALSRTGNPTLDTFLKLVDAIGMKFHFNPARSHQ